MPLSAPNKYYFIAEYSDGTQYEQGADDISLQDPQKNAYYDIFYQPVKPIDTLNVFRLVPVESGFPEYAVDLKCGAFCVNGGWFYPYKVHDRKLTNYRLIYFRVMRAEAVISGEQIDDSRLEVQGYILGFQANDAKTGENVEFLMRF